MDSNFQVTIQANIQSLQKSINEAKVTLSQFEKSANMASVATANFEKSTNKAAVATRNLEQNANRGRMVSFALGQVLRDSGFFAQSFGLGLLAVSNNIPILVDQIALSVKALAPFAGAISLAASALTALLTMWAYNMMAADQSKKSLDSYVDSVDAVSKANLKGAQNAAEELTTLKLLYNQTQNSTLSYKKKKEAIDDLQELYPRHFKALSDEAIIAGKGAKAFEELTKNILASARARAGADILTENLKKEIVLEDRISEAKKAQAQIAKERGLQQQILNAGSIKEIEAAKKAYATAKLSTIINAKAIEDAKILPGLQLELLQLKKEDLRVEAKINEEIKKGGDLKPDFGKDLDINKKTDAFKEYENALNAITTNKTTTELETLNAQFSAQKTLLESLSKETYPGVAGDMKMVADSMVETKNQISALEESSKNLKDVNDKLEKFKKIGDDLSKRRLDIASSIGLKDSEKVKKEIELISDKIIELQAELSKPENATILDFLNREILTLQQTLSGLNLGYQIAVQAEAAQKRLENFAAAVDDIFRNGILNTIASTMSALGTAIAEGGNIGDALGNALIGSIGTVLVEFGKLIIATAVAGEAFSLAMKKLFSPEAWGIALVAGAALIAAGSTISAFASRKTGGSNNSNNNGPSGGSFGGVRPFASGGIIFGDTLGLMGEYPNARSNPEVVAPLDKLTGIIGGSLGDIGGNVGGQLTARISGNDLVILLDRASKNRKNYF